MDAVLSSSKLLCKTELLRSNTKSVLLLKTCVLGDIRAKDSEDEIALKQSSFLPCSKILN